MPACAGLPFRGPWVAHVRLETGIMMGEKGRAASPYTAIQKVKIRHAAQTQLQSAPLTSRVAYWDNPACKLHEPRLNGALLNRVRTATQRALAPADQPLDDGATSKTHRHNGGKYCETQTTCNNCDPDRNADGRRPRNIHRAHEAHLKYGCRTW